MQNNTRKRIFWSATTILIMLACLTIVFNNFLTNSSKAYGAEAADTPNITNVNSFGFCDAAKYNFRIVTHPNAHRYEWDTKYGSASQTWQFKIVPFLETAVEPSSSNDPREAKVKVRLVYPTSTTRHYIYIPEFLNKPEKITAIRLPDDNHDSNDGTVGQITMAKLENLYKRSPSTTPYPNTGITNYSYTDRRNYEYKQVMIEWDNYARYRNRQNGWPTRGNRDGSFLENDRNLFNFAKQPFNRDDYRNNPDMWEKASGYFPGLDFNFDESRYLHWFHDDNDNGYKLQNGRQWVVYYYETTLSKDIFKPNSLELKPRYSDKQNSRVGFMGAEQSGYWYNQTNSFAIPIHIEATPVGGKIHGFYDSPYLFSSLYSTPRDSILPKGMKLSGHFYLADTGETVRNVTVQRGNKCYNFPNGNIDFSGDSLGEIWNILGQEQGTQYFFPPEYSGRLFVGNTLTPTEHLQFSYDIWEDPDFTKQADFIYYDETSCRALTGSGSFVFNGHRVVISPQECSERTRKNDRMRVGYLKGTYQGKTVPIKVMYYLEAKQWRPQRDNRFTVRLRPYVLKDTDETLPLNPVAISPYKNLVKWITFDDNTVNQELRVGNIVQRDVIPGFLRTKCEVLEINALEHNGRNWVNSTLDTWAPGYYYEDGGPWLIGDDRRIAIHQTGAKNSSKVKLRCWGERFDPGIGRDVRVTIPVNGFVTLDSESTDGLSEDGSDRVFESLGMHTDDSNGKYYPIYSFSSCNSRLVDLLRAPAGGNANVPNKVRPAQAKTIAGNIVPWDPSSPSGLVFSNRGGRCGEIPFTQNGDSQYGQGDFGMLFGPALMITAPIDNFNIRDTAPKKDITVAMDGLGKMAIGFGVIISADTSNADFNNLMPPVYQYASLSFNGGKEDKNGQVDWSDPNEFVNNFYYYGARVGKRAVVYDPNRTDNLKVRDGKNNDGQPVELKNFKANPDSEITIQPKIKPITGGPEGSAYVTDTPGKYLVGQDTYQLVVGDDGGKLVPNPRTNRELSVTVPCGKNYRNGATHIRAWADFNGNGVFDPEEASTVATCQPQSSGLYMQPFSKELPWTETAPVTVKFTYPMKHDLNGKRNVWMRVRAVSDTDLTKDDIIGSAANTRETAHGWGESVRRVNPDADAPASSLGSAQGSWKLSESGETEDYLFDITPPPASKDDSFCYAASTASLVFDPLANDRDERKDQPNADKDPDIDLRSPDPASLVFTKEQDSAAITISEGGKRAVVANEGTYVINSVNGKVTFTPTPEFRQKMRTYTGHYELSTLKYAYSTKDENGIYDRSVAATANINGTAASICKLEVAANTWLESTGGYRWSLDKEVLEGKKANPSYVKNDDRGVVDLPRDSRVALSYKIKVKAKAENVVSNAIKGRITLRNPDAQPRQITSFDFYDPRNNGALEGGLSCTVDPGQLPAQLPASGTRTYSFACSTPNTAGSDLATLAHSAAIAVKINGLDSSQQEIIPSYQRDNGEAVYATSAYNVYLKDLLWDSRSSSVSTTMGDVSVSYRIGNNAPTQVKLRDLVINGGQLVAAGSPTDPKNGTGDAEITFTVPEDNQPRVPEANTKVIFNQAKLCIYGDPCVQAIVPKLDPDAFSSAEPTLPDTTQKWRENETYDGTRPNAHPTTKRDATSKVVADSYARVSIGAPVPLKTIYVRKVDNNGAGLVGAEFSIYNDNNDRISTVKHETLAPRDPKVSLAAASEFVAGDLEVLKPYWLVEKKAPRGHHLLAQPVQFQILTDGSIQFLDGYSDFITTERDQSTRNSVIKVRDVEAGFLPASGGRGVIVAIALAIALFGSAYLAARRNNKKNKDNK